MQLSRRQFVQGSITAGVAAAATALTDSPWLLRRTDQIRIGIAGLGASGRAHLALFAAIPCVRIVTLCDPNPVLLHSALRLIESTPNSRVALHDSLDRMLDDPDIDAVSVTGHCADLKRLFRRTAATGKALLIDAPSQRITWPEARAAALIASSSGTIIRAHLSSHLDPGALPALDPELLAILLGSPLTFTLLSRCLSSYSSAPWAPALACLQLVATNAAPNGWSAAFDRHPAPTLSGNPAQRTLNLGATSIAIRSLLGSNAAPAALELQGSRGRAVLLASPRSPVEVSAQTFLSFLLSFRQPSSHGRILLERTLIACALATAIKSSN